MGKDIRKKTPFGELYHEIEAMMITRTGVVYPNTAERITRR